jgi:hypothetical protein
MDRKIEFRILPETHGSDYICPVCGEPWDITGVLDGLKGKGDMSKEEAEMFLNGWGCPCCKSNLPRRLELVNDCLGLLYNLDRKIDKIEPLSLYREEYRKIKDSINTLEQLLDALWKKLYEELERRKR